MAVPGNDQGPRRRDYVVMQQVTLRELLASLGVGELSAELADAVDGFKFDVLLKIEEVKQTRNAEQAMKAAGKRMLRLDPEEPATVDGIAVPSSQWSTEKVFLTPELHVEVGRRA